MSCAARGVKKVGQHCLMPLPIRIASNIDFGKSWTYNLCALYSRYLQTKILIYASDPVMIAVIENPTLTFFMLRGHLMTQYLHLRVIVAERGCKLLSQEGPRSDVLFAVFCVSKALVIFQRL